MNADEEAAAVVARLRGRFRGALFGLALGDALAAPAQYAKPGSFQPVRDLLGGGPYDLPRGAWTDDTALALLLARSLLERHRCDAADLRQRFRRWQTDGEGAATGECLGITASVSRALVEAAPNPELADDADALVRVAPLAMWHYGDDAGLEASLTTMVGVTCHQPATQRAVTAFARLMQRALRGESLVERSGVELLDDVGGTTLPAVGGECAAARLLREICEALQGAKSWKEAVLRAVNAGGDTDVRAAAVGQLAGAVFGIESLPPAWLAALHGREAIGELADELLTEALVRLGETA
ncbi:MAG: ADP-ribosylglycohydrolase family protein [Gammaproteobacteria bacterium]|nr:ADP-ribosylglycohydrolase family protein [Gammaproteobacteria bacterium]